jgi:penicillin-binding protein 2
MLGLISAVANGGTRHKPLVIKRIEFPDGSPIEEKAPISLGTLPASKNTLRVVKKGLRDAVNKPTGTGWIARIAGMDVAGRAKNIVTGIMVGLSPLRRRKNPGWLWRC